MIVRSNNPYTATLWFPILNDPSRALNYHGKYSRSFDLHSGNQTEQCRFGKKWWNYPAIKPRGYDMYAVLPPNDFSHLPIVDPPCATQALVCGQKFPPLENGRQKQQKHSPFPPSEADKRNKIARPYRKRKAQQHGTCFNYSSFDDTRRFGRRCQGMTIPIE